MTDEERRERKSLYNRTYRAKHHDVLCAKDRAYCAANRDQIRKRSSAFRATHRDEIAISKKAYYMANRESILQKKREFYEANPDKKVAIYNKWNARNAERNNAYSKVWRVANRGIVNAHVMKRNAAKLRATPAWADRDVIDAIYREAARLTKETGVSHHVDHIYPLQGKTVCGLHVACNLQILTKTENIRKHNKLPDRSAA